MTLSGKHIIVTGGGTGVGAETAKTLIAQGAKTTIMSRSETPLRAKNMPYQTCDVTDSDSVRAAFDAARADQGPIAGVIANAGASASQPFAKMTADDLQYMLSVNLIGVFNSFQAALPDMKEAGWGRMIAIASVAGLKGFAYVSAYCAAKHGVVGMTRALAQELAKTGITVNAICPGYIDTPMTDRSVANIVEKTGMESEKARAILYANNPQQRFIEADEVAQTAAWLCSDAARSVNGHTLNLTGGEI